MTPFFAGSEPVVATSGKYKGTSILQDEQNRGLALINALTDEQRKKAILRFSKTGNDNPDRSLERQRRPGLCRHSRDASSPTLSAGSCSS